MHRYMRRWALRRQGPDAGVIELSSRRVYIVPTRAGLIFGLVVVTMLLGALNYSNNMGFALAFFLAALGIVAIHHCQRNLAGLKLAVGGCLPVFAGEAIECGIRISNPGAHKRLQIVAGPVDDAAAADVNPGDSVVLALGLPTRRRGRLACPPIRVSTTFPFGFFRAWAWVHPDVELLVYPRPLPYAGEPHGQPASGSESASGDARGADEFVGLTGFVPGEPPSRIAWKALARTGELFAKDYRSGGTLQWLDWERLTERDPELRLSVLTGMVVAAEAAGHAFGLRLPGVVIAPAAGRTHVEQCLRALATIDLGSTTLCADE